MLRHRFIDELPALEHSESLGAILVNLRPGKDIIPLIDVASPLTYNMDIPCSATNPVTCHSMSQILHELHKQKATHSGHQGFLVLRSTIIEKMKEKISSWGLYYKNSIIHN